VYAAKKSGVSKAPKASVKTQESTSSEMEEPTLEPLLPLTPLVPLVPPSPKPSPHFLNPDVTPQTGVSARIEKTSPWYKQWWFYTLVGGVVAAGVTTGVVLGTRSSEDVQSTNKPDAVWTPGSSSVWY
jgi:hypothetical protein